MKFEAGKYYKTRSGKKAYVASTESPMGGEQGTFRMCGYINGLIGVASWMCSGRGSPYGERDVDLIAEWKEPVTVTTWLALWSDGSATCFSYKPDSLLSNCIAIKPVTITEGEGVL